MGFFDSIGKALECRISQLRDKSSSMSILPTQINSTKIGKLPPLFIGTATPACWWMWELLMMLRHFSRIWTSSVFQKSRWWVVIEYDRHSICICWFLSYGLGTRKTADKKDDGYWWWSGWIQIRDILTETQHISRSKSLWYLQVEEEEGSWVECPHLTSRSCWFLFYSLFDIRYLSFLKFQIPLPSPYI